MLSSFIFTNYIRLFIPRNHSLLVRSICTTSISPVIRIDRSKPVTLCMRIRGQKAFPVALPANAKPIDEVNRHDHTLLTVVRNPSDSAINDSDAP